MENRPKLRLIITPPEPSLSSIITDMVLWFIAVLTFSFGVYPAIWGVPVRSNLLAAVGVIGLVFLITTAIREASEMDAVTFYRRLLLAGAPFVARLILD
jgi:hypothetical protein